MAVSMLELHAKEKIGAPEGWSVFQYQSLPKNSRETQVYCLTGAMETLGRNGKRAWAEEPRTEVYITPSEHAVWCAEWERKTGLCSRCAGEKEELARWSAKEETVMRPCGGCKGSGTAQNNIPATGKAEPNNA